MTFSNSKIILTILFALFFNSIYSQSKSVFDANYFRNDNFEPPLRPGKGFNITDVYKQTKFCFTPETSSPSKLVRSQNGGKTSITVYYTKSDEEFSRLMYFGLSGKVSYLNLFSLGGSKLTNWVTESNELRERLIFSAKIDFGTFEFEADPILNVEAKSLIENKQFNDFINLYGTHYISGVRKNAYIWVIVTKTSSHDAEISEEKVNAEVNSGSFGDYNFEVTNKNKTEKFFSEGTFDATIEIQGPILDKTSIENQIKPLLNTNEDISSSIKQVISSSISNISDPSQAIITQYYFTPFTLYGVGNIIWNLKKENQLIKINENVLQVYEIKSNVDELVAPNGWFKVLEQYNELPDFSEKEKYKNELREVFNSILPSLKLFKQTIDLTLSNLEETYNSCSDIQCNPDVNCCNLGDLESNVQDIINKVQIETNKLIKVFEEASTALVNEFSTPDCQKNNKGVLTIVNKSTNPYLIYQDENYIGEIAGKSAEKINVNLGITNFKTEQKSGYLVYPTVNKRTVEFKNACDELTITVGFEE